MNYRFRMLRNIQNGFLLFSDCRVLIFNLRVFCKRETNLFIKISILLMDLWLFLFRQFIDFDVRCIFLFFLQ